MSGRSRISKVIVSLAIMSGFIAMFTSDNKVKLAISFSSTLFVVLTNDPYPPSCDLLGVSIQAFAQICTGARLMPGITVREHALVGANSLVTKDVQSFSCVVGNPARHAKDVREIKLKNGAHAYPWPLRFERGMPWEGIGFEHWNAKRLEQ